VRPFARRCLGDEQPVASPSARTRAIGGRIDHAESCPEHAMDPPPASSARRGAIASMPRAIPLTITARCATAVARIRAASGAVRRVIAAADENATDAAGQERRCHPRRRNGRGIGIFFQLRGNWAGPPRAPARPSDASCDNHARVFGRASLIAEAAARPIPSTRLQLDCGASSAACALPTSRR